MRRYLSTLICSGLLSIGALYGAPAFGGSTPNSIPDTDTAPTVGALPAQPVDGGIQNLSCSTAIALCDEGSLQTGIFVYGQNGNPGGVQLIRGGGHGFGGGGMFPHGGGFHGGFGGFHGGFGGFHGMGGFHRGFHGMGGFHGGHFFHHNHFFNGGGDDFGWGWGWFGLGLPWVYPWMYPYYYDGGYYGHPVYYHARWHHRHAAWCHYHYRTYWGRRHCVRGY